MHSQIAAIFIVIFALISSGEAQLQHASVSIAPIQFIVSELSPSTKVEVMLPSGTGHETFEPGVRHMRAIENSEAYFLLGHPKFEFESSWLRSVVQGRSKPVLVNLCEQCDLQQPDIHLWLVPANMILMAEACARFLNAKFPEQQNAVNERLNNLVLELKKLDDDLHKLFADKQNSTFLVYHPSWGLFAKEYSLKQLAIEAEGKEPGFGDLTDVVKHAKQLNINRIFTEPGTPRSSTEYLAKTLGAEVLMLDPVAGGYLDSLRTSAEEIAKGLR